MYMQWSGTPASIEYARALAANITPEAHESFNHVIACVGGDGTLLEAIRNMPPGTEFLPLNMGTRGYLMNRRMTAEAAAKYINSDNLIRYGFPLLQSGGHRAFNEFCIQPDGDQAAKLEVLINGHSISDEPVIGSGVLISTAAGSTGFNMACQGSARHPRSRDLSVTFINAYSPRVPPMVIPEGSNVTVRIHEMGKRPCKLVADGKNLGPAGEYITVEQAESVYIWYYSDHDFLRRMIGKVIR